MGQTMKVYLPSVMWTLINDCIPCLVDCFVMREHLVKRPIASAGLKTLLGMVERKKQTGDTVFWN